MSTSADTPHLDLLVVGSGVAGLSAAVRAAEHGLSVGVLTKGMLEQATTRWAQGGIAAVVGGDPDSTDIHLADTLAAGVGLCDETAVRVLVDEGPKRVMELIALGAVFDRDEAGALALAREGGHSAARVVHAGGAATGVEVERALVAAVCSTAAVLLERWFAIDLLVDGSCRGVSAVDGAGVVRTVTADHVLMAAGGAGQMFAVTTNPLEATGDGVAMGLRAGVAVADLEFVQFHPTALHHPLMPRPLLSEALRGHGALLRDRAGGRFVDELSPRDVVSRAMTRRMLEQGADHLWLDATGLEAFAVRFPTIAAALDGVGLDPGADWLPIAPAAHYLCGGILTDLDGATTLPGLWAAGEVACAGIHGANRLASNSLLDGMVFGARVIEAVAAGRRGPSPTGAMEAVAGLVGGPPPPSPPPGYATTGGGIAAERLVVDLPAVGGGDGDPAEVRADLQQVMTREAGVVRTGESLAAAAGAVESLAARSPDPRSGSDAAEAANLVTVASALVAAAAAWAESRGAHEGRLSRDGPSAPAPPGRLLTMSRRRQGWRGPHSGAGWEGVDEHTPTSGPIGGPSADALFAAPAHEVRAAVGRALAEDLTPLGDLTASLVVPDAVAVGALVARRSGVLAGSACATEAFLQVDPAIRLGWRKTDGDRLEPGDLIAAISGPLAPLLTAERTALNFLGHLSGIATMVARWVEVADGGAVVWDTRKTTPGLRALEKAAVRAGGGANHRANLSDWIMLKDNHLTGTDIAVAVKSAHSRWPGRTVHVECDDLEQVRECLRAGADAILLDNMTPAEVRTCVAEADSWKAEHGRRPLLEASGGITLDSLADYATTGVDCISSGALTNASPALDIGLDLEGSDR